MLDIDFKKLKRNPTLINSKLLLKEDRTIAKEELSILIPKYYFNKNLAKKNNKSIELTCVFPILDAKGNYAIVAESSKQNINYARVEDVNVGDDVYEQYTYLAGDCILESTSTIKSEEVLFAIFECFFMLGKLPKFLSYMDVSNLFSNAAEYTGSYIGDYPTIIDIMVAILSRDASNMNVIYKDLLQTAKDLNKPIAYVGLTDIDFAITNNGSRMISGYFEDNLRHMLKTDERKNVKDIDVLRR